MVIGDPVTDLDLRLDCSETSVSEDGNVMGTVPGALSLTLGPTVNFGSFLPGVSREYAASTTAFVTSSAGDATLTVYDGSGDTAGHLINGAFRLPAPLRARAATADSGPQPFREIGAALPLFDWAQPVRRPANSGVPAPTSTTASAGTFARRAAATIASAEGAS